MAGRYHSRAVTDTTRLCLLKIVRAADELWRTHNIPEAGSMSKEEIDETEIWRRIVVEEALEHKLPKQLVDLFEQQLAEGEEPDIALIKARKLLPKQNQDQGTS
jgi:hypothetical protein